MELCYKHESTALEVCTLSLKRFCNINPNATTEACLDVLDRYWSVCTAEYYTTEYQTQCPFSSLYSGELQGWNGKK